MKAVILVEFLTDEGRWYQRQGVETEKARSPVRVRDMGILNKMFIFLSQGVRYGDIKQNASE